MPSIEQISRLLAAICLLALLYACFLFLWKLAFGPSLFANVDLATVGSPNERIVITVIGHGVSFISGLLVTVLLLNVYVYYGFGIQPDVYRRGDRHRPTVALTFDDGPSPDYTPKILDILHRHNVKATFFMIGAHVEAYPHIARAIVEKGHEVGNHTWSHVNVLTTDTQTLYEEIIKTSLIILETTGVYPKFSRPARGLYDGRFRRMSDLLGHRVVLWTRSAQDWREPRNAATITRRVVDRVKPGDILLFHDSGGLINYTGGSRHHTIQALEGVIEGVRAKGLEFALLSEFLTDVEGEPGTPDVLSAPPA